MKFLNFSFLIVLLVSIFGCKDKDNNSQSETNTTKIATEAVLSQNYDAPFSLKFSDNKILNMKKVKDGFNIDNNATPTLFAFFSTWCPPCRIQLPVLNSIQEKYGKKLQVIGVLMGEDLNATEVLKFKKEKNINFKISYESSSNDFFATTLGGISEIPFIAIYDKNGKFVSQYFGIVPEEILTFELEKFF